MRVVVTRPEPQGLETARRLRAMGHEPVILPLFAARHDLPATRRAMALSAGGLIVTSAEAVRALAAAGEDLAPFLNRPVYTVGQATAVAVAALGFRQIETADGNGASLAGLIRDRQTPETSAPLLYLAGEPRSADLETGLSEGGVSFEAITVYRMAPLVHDPERLRAALDRGINDGETAVLLYSAQTARRFATLCRQADLDTAECRFLCLSHAIASALPPEWRARTRVAAQPLEKAMLALTG